MPILDHFSYQFDLFINEGDSSLNISKLVKLLTCVKHDLKCSNNFYEEWSSELKKCFLVNQAYKSKKSNAKSTRDLVTHEETSSEPENYTKIISAKALNWWTWYNGNDCQWDKYHWGKEWK